MPSTQTSFHAPSYQLSGFHGSRDTLRAMVSAALGLHGERSSLVRSATEEAIGKLFPKAYDSEILSICFWAMQKVRYVNDPMHLELVKTPERLVTEIRQRGFARGDCDDIACLIATMCLQVGRNAQFVVVGFGDKGSYSHVFARVQEPRTKKWIVCDPVAGSDVRSMLNKVKTYQIWSLDEAPGTGPIVDK